MSKERAEQLGWAFREAEIEGVHFWTATVGREAGRITIESGGSIHAKKMLDWVLSKISAIELEEM